MKLIDADELLKVINDPEELRYAVLHAEPHDAIPIKWIKDEIEILKKQDDWVLKTFREYSDFSTPYEVLLKKWREYETDKRC